MTGISLISSAMGAKRVELLHDLVAPGAKIALFMNPDNPNAAAEQRDAQEAAHALGHSLVVLNARNRRDFDAAFDAFVREGAKALFVATDPMLMGRTPRSCPCCSRRSSNSCSILGWPERSASPSRRRCFCVPPK